MGTDRLHDVICYIIFYFKKCSEINKNENLKKKSLKGFIDVQ